MLDLNPLKPYNKASLGLHVAHICDLLRIHCESVIGMIWRQNNIVQLSNFENTMSEPCLEAGLVLLQIGYVKGLDLSPGEISEAKKRYTEARQKRQGEDHWNTVQLNAEQLANSLTLAALHPSIE